MNGSLEREGTRRSPLLADDPPHTERELELHTQVVRPPNGTEMIHAGVIPAKTVLRGMVHARALHTLTVRPVT